jgi:hypothetical protein
MRIKPHYYVYRQGGQAPTRKHETLVEALYESKRLAERHPNVEFEILKVVGVSFTTAAETLWDESMSHSEINDAEDGIITLPKS